MCQPNQVSEEAGVKFMRQWIERMEFLEEGRIQERLDLLRKLIQRQHMTAEEAVSFWRFLKQNVKRI